MRILVCISALAALGACGMLDVKQQQKKMTPTAPSRECRAERKDEVPLIVWWRGRRVPTLEARVGQSPTISC